MLHPHTRTKQQFMQTLFKAFDSNISLQRVGLLVLATMFFANAVVEASGPRSRSVQSRAPSGWQGIDLRQHTEVKELEPEIDQQLEQQPEQKEEVEPPVQVVIEPTVPTDKQPIPAAEPQPPAVESSTARQETPQPLFQLRPRERRSGQYHTLRAPAPIESPLEQRNPVRPSVRHALTTDDRPRSAPSILEFQKVLAEIKAEEEAEREEEERRREEDSGEQSGSRPPGRTDRTASTGSESPIRRFDAVDDILDPANLLAPYQPIINNDRLFIDEPLATIRLNEILYYLNTGDRAQVIRLAPGNQSNPYFNPPVSTEFQRSRAVYEQVFRSNVQTR